MAEWIDCRNKGDQQTEFGKVSIASISAEDIITDAFRPIARDGAGNIEVCLKLVAALEAIKAVSPDLLGPAATAMADDLLDRIRSNMSHAPDVGAIEAAVKRVVN